MKAAVLGAGVIGDLMVSALLGAGYAPKHVVATTRSEESGRKVAEKHGVDVRWDEGANIAAVEGADVVVLSVKPQMFADLLSEIAPAVAPGQLVLSMAAGISTEWIEARLPGASVVRVMPNTPSLVGKGVHGVSAGAAVTEQQLQSVELLLAPTGLVVRIDEELQDALTAVSGCGPAYFFLFVESMIQGGVSLGLPRELASQLAVQTIVGAGALLRQTGDAPEVLRARVTSKGGSTAEAIATFEAGGLGDLVARAMTAARDRSRELGQ